MFLFDFFMNRSKSKPSTANLKYFVCTTCVSEDIHHFLFEKRNALDVSFLDKKQMSASSVSTFKNTISVLSPLFVEQKEAVWAIKQHNAPMAGTKMLFRPFVIAINHAGDEMTVSSELLAQLNEDSIVAVWQYNAQDDKLEEIGKPFHPARCIL